MNKEFAIELFNRNKLDEALKVFEDLTETLSSDADVHCYLGLIKERLGNATDAVVHYNEALKHDPNLVPALANLGNHLKNCGLISSALDHFERAIRQNCRNSLIISNYANVAISAGEVKKAYELYEKALDLKADNLNALNNYLISTLYTNHFSAQQVYEMHCRYSEVYGEKEKQLALYDHDKIRIGYVSGDFKRHSVAYFIEGLLHFHNREKFEIFCYSDVLKEDEITQRLKSFHLVWRSIPNKTDDEVHKQILKDEIDILVDLGAHTGKRLGVFAKRSAPIQVNYLGYADTSGLKNMDLRIVDELTDEPDFPTSEKIVKLKRCFLAFCPPESRDDLEDTPYLKNGYLTIGSFNNLPKLTDEVLRLWMRILKSIPNSRLLLKTKSFNDEGLKSKFLEKFTKRGIDAERIELLGYELKLSNHLDLYKRIDIALDPFPYNGTTTTCEALFMGVPVVALKGTSKHAARVSCSLLETIGLRSLIADNKNEYAGMVKKLAENPQTLNELHHSIRPMMFNSPLCNSKDLTEQIEFVFEEEIEKARQSGPSLSSIKG